MMRSSIVQHVAYRVSVWLPLMIPAIVLGVVNGLGIEPTSTETRKFVQVMALSLLYGGIPYGVLALWATFWIDGKPEPEIRRLAFRAPFLMAAMFAVAAVCVGLAVGRLSTFLALAVLGAVASVLLGYAYVALVLCVRGVYGSLARR
jgi:hypothetical protein